LPCRAVPEFHQLGRTVMRTRILFVDDEPNVLSGLRRMLYPMRTEWDMAFVDSGPSALAVLEQQPHDVVVSDMRMPKMDGARLLAEIRKRYPQTIRIILSGYSDQEMILKSIGVTHQYLAKPCDPTILRSTIQRAVALSSLLTDERIKGIVSHIDCLPSMPTLFAELADELQRPTSSLESVGQIISKDPGMTAQILRLVNSAFFGLRHEITSPGAAVSYLGINTVGSLVLTSHIFAEIDPAVGKWLDLDRLWKHTLRTGGLARGIAMAESAGRRMVDDALAAGLIHDAGRLILATKFSEMYRQVLAYAASSGCDVVQAEREWFGVTHAEVGAYLMGIWGLPNSVTEALAYHHNPRDCVHREFSPLTAVHAACALDHERSDACGKGNQPHLDMEYLSSLKLTDHIDPWHRLSEETVEVPAK
jgi:HD-like signal output (HDOD) protein/CheY-like chemotaxis protein